MPKETKIKRNNYTFGINITNKNLLLKIYNIESDNIDLVFSEKDCILILDLLLKIFGKKWIEEKINVD